MSAATLALQFDEDRLARLAESVRLVGPTRVDTLADPAVAAELGEIEIVLSSWGGGRITDDLLERMPRLRAVLHAAGTVRHLLTETAFERGIVVANSADENAVPVAEFTQAMLVLAGKKAPFVAESLRRDPGSWRESRDRWGTMSNFGRRIGLVGFSRIGRLVTATASRMHDVEVLVADPFADPVEVAERGGRLVPLTELLPQVDTLSLHAPNLPSTRKMIGAAELALLPDQAVVINTARGAIMDTDALVVECASGRLSAILDVTDPDEPLPVDHPLWSLPNVMITPHIAGSMGSETKLMTDGTLTDLERILAGLTPLRGVTLEAYRISA